MKTSKKKQILNWIQYGLKEGDKNNNIFKPLLNINKTEPDLQVKMESPYITSGENIDEFLMMKFPFELDQDTFIRKIEFVPDNKQIVHHVNAHLITLLFQ